MSISLLAVNIDRLILNQHIRKRTTQEAYHRWRSLFAEFWFKFRDMQARRSIFLVFCFEHTSNQYV